MRITSAARKILKSFPQDVQDFFAAKDKELSLNGFALVLSHGRSVNNGGGRCSGFFDSALKEIRVALGNEHPLQIFLHEVNHASHFLEEDSVWHTESLKADRFWAWIKGAYERHPERLVLSVMKIEHDCERRTLLEIKKNWSHLIDPKAYAAMSNAYVASHVHILETRSWLKKSPYVSKITAHAPTELVEIGDWPENLMAALKKFL